jgi:NTE family protein
LVASSDPGIPVEIVGIRREQVRRALGRNELFGNLGDEILEEIERELVLLSYRSGATLLREGEHGDCLYLIVSGRVRVSTEPNGTEVILAEFSAGQAVGEMAVLTGEARNATVRAIRDTQAARLTQAAFDRLVQRRPREILRACSRNIIGRFRRQIEGPGRHLTRLSTIAVLPVHEGVPLDDASQRLATALGALDATAWLNSERAGRSLDAPNLPQARETDPEDARLAAWLSDQEFSTRYCVYQCDQSFSPWTQRCLRQADHIVLTACADHPGKDRAWESQLLAAGPSVSNKSRSLLLLQRDGIALPSATSDWLAAVNVQQHFHVRQTRQADYERVARMLTGNAVGLVLGGGGARGFAHLGVIRALREAGIPLDAIGGTSVGALFGAQAALGWDDETMLRGTLAVTHSLMDRTLPLVALAAGRRFAHSLQEMFREIRIEDLWIPFYTISANLTRAEVKVHNSGPLWFGVLASNNAPVIYPPLIDEGDLYVDGGLLNNVPVDEMSRQLQGGTIIAVDLTPPVDLDGTPDYGVGLSGWNVLYRRLNPFLASIEAPGILSLVGRAAELGSIAFQRSIITELADLILRPPVREFAVTDHKLGERISQVGYDYARDQFAHWQPPARGRWHTGTSAPQIHGSGASRV